MSQSENSNQPKCIKQKRRNNLRAIDSDSTSTGTDSSNSEDDAEDIIYQKRKKKSKEKSNKETLESYKFSEKVNSSLNGGLQLKNDLERVKLIKRSSPENDTTIKNVENVLDINERIPGLLNIFLFGVVPFFIENKKLKL